MKSNNFDLECWEKEDIERLNEYLVSISNPDRVEWLTKIVNTNLKVLSVRMKCLDEIVKEIRKGNMISYLDCKNFETLDALTIYGKLIVYLKDIDLIKKYLYLYLPNVDNWQLIDIVSFKIKEENADKFLNLAKELIKVGKPFYIRMGVRIIFNMLSFDKYLEDIFNILAGLKTSEEYYVNMMVAWTLCEGFIKQRERTLVFLETGEMNDFVANKTVSKCRDSFRVSDLDKEMLLKFRRK